MLEKIKHESSERYAVKGQEADTDFSNGIFNCITGEDFSQGEWLRSKKVVKFPSLETIKT